MKLTRFVCSALCALMIFALPACGGSKTDAISDAPAAAAMTGTTGTEFIGGSGSTGTVKPDAGAGSGGHTTGPDVDPTTGGPVAPQTGATVPATVPTPAPAPAPVPSVSVTVQVPTTKAVPGGAVPAK